MTRKCENCVFYDGDDYTGICRRNPPVMIRNKKYWHGEDTGETEVGWAQARTMAESWCGEFVEGKFEKEY